jgi:hypothetical protein
MSRLWDKLSAGISHDQILTPFVVREWSAGIVGLAIAGIMAAAEETAKGTEFTEGRGTLGFRGEGWAVLSLTVAR